MKFEFQCWIPYHTSNVYCWSIQEIITNFFALSEVLYYCERNHWFFCVCARQTDSMKLETWNDESNSLETSGTFISKVYFANVRISQTHNSLKKCSYFILGSIFHFSRKLILLQNFKNCKAHKNQPENFMGCWSRIDRIQRCNTNFDTLKSVE